MSFCYPSSRASLRNAFPAGCFAPTTAGCAPRTASTIVVPALDRSTSIVSSSVNARTSLFDQLYRLEYQWSLENATIAIVTNCSENMKLSIRRYLHRVGPRFERTWCIGIEAKRMPNRTPIKMGLIESRLTPRSSAPGATPWVGKWRPWRRRDSRRCRFFSSPFE
jgi:hypothetical protein